MNDREVAFLTRFVEESDAIESIENAPGEITRQLDEEHNSHRMGHAGALLRLRDYATVVRIQLSERMIKEVQRLITEEQHLKGERALPVHQRGQWRDCEVMVGGRFGEVARIVPIHMRHLIDEVRQWQEQYRGDHSATETVRFIARFHWQYELVHPFADGNGRSGRALVYYLYRWAGLEPFVFTHEDRFATYYPCFNEWGSDRMESYFLERSRAKEGV